MRFSIRTKIMVIGSSLMIFATALAMVVSMIVNFNISEKQLISNIDSTMDEMQMFLETTDIEDSDSTDYPDKSMINFIYRYKNRIQSIYETLEEPNFETEEEKIEFYSSVYSFMGQQSSGSMGLSMDRAIYYRNYMVFLTRFIYEANTQGVVTGYLAFKDEEKNRLVFIASTKDTTNEDHYMIGMHYDLKPGEAISESKDGSLFHEFKFDSSSHRAYEIKYNNEPVCYVLFEYTNKPIMDSSLRMLGIQMIGLIGIAIVLSLLYGFLSNKFIIKNIIILNESTKEFTNNLNQNKIEYLDINFKSNDEIKDLASSFKTLENTISSHIKTIETQAAERQKIDSELNIASRIQLESLPDKIYDDININLEAFISPAVQVGGDFYDYYYIDNHRFIFTISDVTGHGMPAALYMMRSLAVIKTKLLFYDNLSEALYDINNEFVKNNKEGLFVTSFIGLYDFRTKELEYIRAGHEKPYLIRDKKLISLGENSNFVIGGIENFRFKSEKIELKENDKLSLFTDGLNESIDENNNEFGYKGIEDSLLKSITNGSDIIQTMHDDLITYTKNGDMFDDVTMMLIEFKESKMNLHYEKPDYSIIKDATTKFNEKFNFINKKILSEIGIIFDELLNNYISYEKVDNLIVDINISIYKDEIKMVFENNGLEFNPLSRDDKYISNDTNLTEGGLGITIVKNLSSDIQYERKNDRNVLTIIKKI